MNYQKSQEGYKMKFTKESFEEVLQEAYDALEPQDIIDLLGEVLTNLKNTENYNEFIHSVANDVYDKKNISFKQWKALSAYLSDCRKKQNKTF
jgi:predicted Zn-dependent protease with MMP-like domain